MTHSTSATPHPLSCCLSIHHITNMIHHSTQHDRGWGVACPNHHIIHVIEPQYLSNTPLCYVACPNAHITHCLLYTSDAADEPASVDLGGRRIIKKIFFKQKTAYEIQASLVGSEMCIRDSYWPGKESSFKNARSIISNGNGNDKEDLYYNN